MTRWKKILITAGIALVSACAAAQNYPNKTVRIIVPFGPGGATDALARALAHSMTESWGQSVIVENKPGAGGNLGAEQVARSPADGYTMIMAINSFTTNASLYSKLPYDPFKDFQPVSLFAVSPNVIAARPDLPANNVTELIKLAQTHPGKITYGSAGPGSGSHLAGALFAKLAGVRMTHVPYKGVAQAVTDLMGGQIDLSFSVYSVVAPQISAGKLKALAVTTAKRSANAPNIPTVAEAGLKGYDVFSWFGILVPAGTPPAVISAIHEQVANAARSPDLKEKFAAQGLELVGNSPEDFAEFLRQDFGVWDKVIKGSNIKVD